MKKTEAQKKADLVMEQVKWIQDCGGTLDGYRAKYDHPFYNAEEIFTADMLYLKRIVNYAVGVSKDILITEKEYKTLSEALV